MPMPSLLVSEMLRARARRILATVSLTGVCAGCVGDSPNAPTPAAAGLRVVSGGGVTDTALTTLAAPLVAELRNADGSPARGVLVRMDVQESTEPVRVSPAIVLLCTADATTCRAAGQTTAYSPVAFDTTDSQGRVSAIVRFNSLIGTTTVRISVPERGFVDSARFTVRPGAVYGVRVISTPQLLDIGASTTIVARTIDSYGNQRSADAVALSASPGNAIALDPATGVVTGRDIGVQNIFARFGDNVDTTSVSVVPAAQFVMWNTDANEVRLVSTNATLRKVIATNIGSGRGAFPRLDASRRQVVMRRTDGASGLLIVDTSGALQREVNIPASTTTLIAHRPMSDGTIRIVGISNTTGSNVLGSMWRVAPDNRLTSVGTVPGMIPYYGGVDVSPDGTKVAYSRLNGPSRVELCVLDIASSAITVLAVDGRAPSWSPSGTQLAFLDRSADPFDFEDGGSLAVINADGTGRRALDARAYSPGIGWSPDGKYLAARTVRTIRIVRVNDGISAALVFPSLNGSGENYYQPEWR